MIRIAPAVLATAAIVAVVPAASQAATPVTKPSVTTGLAGSITPESATLTGLDLDGNEISYAATGLFARMFQHEYDHLNGFLYVDRLQGKWARKAKKAVKANSWGKPGLTWMPGVDRDPFGHDDVDEYDEDDVIAEGGHAHSEDELAR